MSCCSRRTNYGRQQRQNQLKELPMRGGPSCRRCRAGMPGACTWTGALAKLAVLAAAPVADAASVDYGPISHKGLKPVGAASTSLELQLQLGLIGNQSGLQ